MAIDKLHDRIRRMKSPIVLDLSVKRDFVPSFLWEEETDFCKAYFRFCKELIEALQDKVPAVRFSFGSFALLGADGLRILSELTQIASDGGYYVLLDGPEILTPWDADRTADVLSFENCPWKVDGVVISPYIGTDALLPFLGGCRSGRFDVFVAVRTPNKTAAELQDLMTGTRLVHQAAMETVKRHGESMLTKCGYSRIGALLSATSPNSLRNMRGKYPEVFFIVDGIDYPSGNAKNCSYGFDRFGYGAAVNVGPGITAAWKSEETDGKDYISQAVDAADRINRNLLRYITIL